MLKETFLLLLSDFTELGDQFASEVTSCCLPALQTNPPFSSSCQTIDLLSWVRRRSWEPAHALH